MCAGAQAVVQSCVPLFEAPSQLGPRLQSPHGFHGIVAHEWGALVLLDVRPVLSTGACVCACLGEWVWVWMWLSVQMCMCMSEELCRCWVVAQWD